MLKPGRMKEIMEEIGTVKVDVVALQEICWQGQGRIDEKDFSLFYRIYYKLKNEERFLLLSLLVTGCAN